MKQKLLDALNEGIPEIVDKTENMFTTGEYAKAIGMAENNALRRLNKLEAAGKVRRARFKHKRADGVTHAYMGWEYIGASR